MTPFKQCYVVTMENNAIFLCVVMDPTFDGGRDKARSMSEEVAQCAAWDCCNYPQDQSLDVGCYSLLKAR